MIKEVIAFGCSFTYGDGINHKDSWPFILGKKMGIPVKNYGLSGGSNKLIANEIFRLIDPVEHKDSLVVVCWTSFLRSSLWDEDERVWEPVIVQQFTRKEKFRDAVDYYYANMFTPYDAFFTMFTIKMAVESYLKSNGIRYVFLNALHDEWDYQKVVDNILHRMRESHDKRRYMDFYSSIYELICHDREQFICSDKYHPSEAGHDLVAGKLADFINTNKLLERIK